jgi:hypothetical protein
MAAPLRELYNKSFAKAGAHPIAESLSRGGGPGALTVRWAAHARRPGLPERRVGLTFAGCPTRRRCTVLLPLEACGASTLYGWSGTTTAR